MDTTQDEDTTPILSPDICAWLDEMDAWDALTPFEKNQRLGGAPHMSVDLSDTEGVL